MTTPVTKTVGPQSTTDFGSLIEMETQNLNLVGLDQSYTVNVSGNVYGNLSVAGWATDATRFLRVAGPVLPSQSIVNGSNPLDRVCLYDNGTTSCLSVTDVGAGGFAVFENLTFRTPSNFASVVSAANCKVRFINCIFYEQSSAGATQALHINNATCTIECINCLIISRSSSGRGAFIQACAAGSKMYHCTFIGIAAGVNLNNQTITLKNCYASGTVGYQNAGSATLVTCASSDASGSLGLQNVTFDYTNWNSGSPGFDNDTEPINSNPCMAGGTDLSGEGAPFNVSTDQLGVSYVIATPSVGCRQYTVKNPRIRHIYVDPSGATSNEQVLGDFATLGALSAVNRDLVANQEIWFVEGCFMTDGSVVVFDGWNTNPTYYLHIRPRSNGLVNLKVQKRNKTAANTTGYSYNRSLAGNGITIGNIGATGLLIFDSCQIGLSNGGVNHLFTNSAAGTGGEVQLRNCSLYGNTNGFLINGPVGGGNKFTLVNDILVVPGGSGGKAVDWNANVFKAYHCTFVSTSGSGGTKTVVDMHDTAGCVLKNCHSHINVWTATSWCYKNLNNVTFTKCSSSDSTGSEVGLQNIPYDATNFLDTNIGVFWGIPKSTGLLYGAGADVSGESFPLNCLKDFNGSDRQSGNPTIGAFECPIQQHPDYNGAWTFQNTGVNTAKAAQFTSLVEFSVNGKLYASTSPRAGQAAEIYSTSDDGANWVLEYTNPTLNDAIFGGVEFGGKLFFVANGSCNLITFDPSGPTWTTGTNFLNGAAGNPNTGKGIFVLGSKLYCLTSFGGGPGKTLYSSSNNGATWAAETFPAYHTAGGFFAGTTNAGDLVVGVTDNGKYFLWKRAGASHYSVAVLLPWLSVSSAGAIYIDKVNRKVYFTGQNSCPALPNGFTTVAEIDLASETIRIDTLVDGPLSDGVTKNYFVTKIGNDIWWGAVQDGTPSGINFFITANSPPFRHGTFMTRMNITANASYASQGFVSGQNAVLHNGRMFIAAGTGTAQFGGVLRSPLLFNAVKFDDVVVQGADWNGNDYAVSVDVQASSPSVSGYVRQTVKTKDSSAYAAADRNQYLRRVRDGYSIPPSGFFKQYRDRVSLGTGRSANREDGFRYAIRVHKHLQKVNIDGPCAVSGLIPHSFVHPSEPFATETASFLSKVPIDNFMVRFLWLPTFSSNDLGDNDVEIMRVEHDANNYVALVALAGDRWEREYSDGNVYGPHDPILRVKKVRGGVVTATADISGVYFANSFLEPTSEALDDSMLVEVTHHAGSLIGLRVNRGGVVGEAVSAADTASFGVTGLKHLRYTGVGYYGEPTLLSMVDSGQNEPVQRRLPTYRSDIVRRTFGRNAPAVLAGERDPTGGQVVQNMPYVDVDDFNRPDDPSLGSDWGLIKETGAGWSISSNQAVCSEAGFQYWANRRPGHKDYMVQGKVTVNFDNDLVGVLLRTDIENVNPAKVYSLGVELIQTGAAAASLRVTRFYNDSKEILATAVLSSYTTGTQYVLRVTTDGGVITGRIYTLADTSFLIPLATVSGSDDIFFKPGVVGIYGTTGGVGQTVSFDDWSLAPNFKQFARDL